MKPLYSLEEFNSSTINQKLRLECYQCESEFYVLKRYINKAIRQKKNIHKFCSKTCFGLSRKNPNLLDISGFNYDEFKKNIDLQNVGKQINVKTNIIEKDEKNSEVNCKNCNINFNKKITEIKRSKSGNHFCCRSCSVSYNNKHKTTGSRRSKIEIFIEEGLRKNYPTLEIHFNQKSIISSELDIYIPSLNIAFEINGIFHYKPIYGVDKLYNVMLNDLCKQKNCEEKNIKLFILNISNVKTFNLDINNYYLDLIKKIIGEFL